MGLDSPFKDQLFFKPAGRWTIALAVAASVSISGVGVYQLYQAKSQTAAPAPAPTLTPTKDVVTALGRLEPQGEVIKLSAPSSIEGTRLAQLLVKQGDRIQAGQVIGILDSRDRLQAALEEAKRQVQVAQANLAKVKAGAKRGEIDAQNAETARLEAQLRGEISTQQATIARWQAQLVGEKRTQQATIARLQAQQLGERRAQQATIARLQAELNNALAEFERYRLLYQQGAERASTFDSKRLAVETTREQLNEAQASLRRSEETLQQQIAEAQASLRQSEETLQQQIREAQATLSKTQDTLKQQIEQSKATLNQIAEVRPTDVQAAQAEVDKAIATVKKAQAELDLAFVRSPINGQVLKVITRAGERISDDGVLELGQTDQMYVVAEVYETEISKVRLGQLATIEGNAFSGELKGKVDLLGLKIGKKDILNDDPATDKDARVVEVKIRLNPEDSKRVTGLTNLQVEVAIDVSHTSANSPSFSPSPTEQ